MIRGPSPQNEDKRGHERGCFDATQIITRWEERQGVTHSGVSLYQNKWLLLPTSGAWAARRRLQLNRRLASGGSSGVWGEAVADGEGKGTGGGRQASAGGRRES
jgi:hypothetical protein